MQIQLESGGFSCDTVRLLPNSPTDIRVSEIDGLEDPPAIGALVMQGEELAAIVTGYDAENHEYLCISAEQMATDLCRKIHEERVRMERNAKREERNPYRKV